MLLYTMIVKIEKSPVAMKRYRVTMDNGKTYDFGYYGGRTYIDGRTVTERENYRKRHLANDTEKRLIENLIPSPSLFSYYLLWGSTTSLRENIKRLNAKWKKNNI